VDGAGNRRNLIGRVAFLLVAFFCIAMLDALDEPVPMLGFFGAML
jgi:hypothetical protein